MALNDAQRQAIAAIDGPPREEQPQPKQKNTSEGQAQTGGAPKSEASQMAESPFIELDMGNGQMRQMTHEQIKGMASRYTALNHKNAQLKPVNDVIENFLKANPNMNPAQLAQQLQQLAAAQSSDVQFGRDGGVNSQQGQRQQQQPQQQQQRDTSDEEFSKWENENASTLPPGYKQMHSSMQQMMAAMQQQNQMMQQLMGASAGHVDAARQAQQGAQQMQGQSIQAVIGTNLDRAQQALGLPSEAANDFMMFAQQRGYNMEDFVDGQLTAMVMQDFKNNMQSPEMDRLRQIHSRRTAFTPNGGQAPMGGGGGQVDPQQADFQEFAGRQMAGK